MSLPGEALEPGRPAPLLRMRGLCKRFGPTVALDHVDLEVMPGEVHALIGENGAGKSTLMKILSGALRPDAGAMELAGRGYRPRRPQEGRDAGVAMIYQELTLAPHLTVAENIMLGRERSRCGWVRQAEHRRIVEGALRELQHADIDPATQVRRLGVGAQQLVEIARALAGRARVIVMDEPTSSLSQTDTARLFGVVRRLRDAGVSIVYISHFLEEVQQVGDRFTVLRDGRTVTTGAVAQTPVAAMVEAMVGRQLDEMFPRRPRERGPVILSLDRLAGRRLPREVSLDLHRGEILGLAGLVGAGRTETLRALYGLAPIRSGRVRVGAFASGRTLAPARRLAQGMGLLSEDRKSEGLALRLPIADNVALGRHARYARFGWIRARRQEAGVRRWLERMEVKARHPWQKAAELSGGNQQKLALCRLLHHEVDVLLLDEPTRGIDVGSKVQIYHQMGAAAAAGRAVLFVSSYLPELLGVCDRIGVMCRGVLADVRPAAEWDETSIMTVATGGRG